MAFPSSPVNGQQATINGVVYTYSTALTAWTVTSSGGSLTLATAAVITGNVTGNYFIGNGSLLTGISGGGGGGASISNGTSNVTVVSSGGNATVGIGGTGNVAVFATTGQYVTGLISASGNIITAANMVVGGGSGGNITGVNVISANIVSATGNITGGNLIGRLANGTSNISIPAASGNIIFSVNGVSTSADITQYGIEANTIQLGNLTGAPTAWLTLPAADGGAGITAVKFNPGAFAASPQAGSLNFDGNVFRMTAIAGNESVTMNSYYYRTNANITLSSVNTAQAWLGVGVRLQANTVYAFNGLFNLTTTGTSSHTEAVGMGGTATLFNIGYNVTRANANAVTATTGNTYITYRTSNASVVQTGAFTTAQNVVYTLDGTVSTNATGTFIPQLTFSAAPGGTSTVVQGAYFQITALQGGNGNVNIGTWA